MPRLLLLLAPLVLGACHGGGSRDSCESVAANFQTLARTELDVAKVDDATRRDAADQIPAMRDSLVGVCKDGKWSAQVRECMAKAADHVALQACEVGLSDDQRRAIDKAASGQTGDPSGE